jgi:hypothetical protein
VDKLTLIGGLCRVGLINPIGIVDRNFQKINK